MKLVVNEWLGSWLAECVSMAWLRFWALLASADKWMNRVKRDLEGRSRFAHLLDGC